MPEKSTTGISDNINKYEVTVSALLSMTIIIIILAVILYLAYITAALYLSAVHDTRPPRPVVYVCCLLAIVSVSLNGAYGVEATGLLFLSILTGLLTVMTLTDIAVCRLPRIFTLSLIVLGAAFRYSPGGAHIQPPQRITLVRHDIPATAVFHNGKRNRSTRPW